ncbi:hypothetical protein P280DRAFT_387047 [Massarina eburnea CBS 473.64]|uniref:DUF7728 domain-containing protein n=1 Tax=Massarina eburnea CBS 473.64 TaxID=1395130 RepID=A0A6A6SGX9_9PLEO|nr:hypothetical protein P280DRAFT_387047 [Massarina eburnea CBS 473.64]
MICRTLGLTALVAVAANAILIPPSVTAADLGDDSAMEITVNPMKRTVSLECPTCAFATKQGQALSWQQEAGNSFLLDFDVGTNEDKLQVDGVQLYPPTFGYFKEPFSVTQVDPSAEDGLRLRVTGYMFHYSSAETVSEAGIELLPMTFRITSIEGQPVNPPALTVNLLKDTNGRLMIASFETAKDGEASPADQEKECNDWPLLCKWRAILADRINGLKSSARKGCHKHKGNNPMAEEGIEGKPPHRFRPGHPHHEPRPHHMKGPHHHHHHHQSQHRLRMFLRRAFFTILVPILIGVFAGTLTYLIGMALGCVIAVVVAKVRGRAPYERIALEDEEAEYIEEPSEKQIYAELPGYEAPPVYEETTEKEVVVDENANETK